MANFYNLLQRDSTNWSSCKQALSEKIIDMTAVPTDDFAGKIRDIAIQTSDGFEKTPELRSYPNIEKNFRSDALFTSRMMIIPEATLPAVSVQVVGCNQINWGDGSGWQTIAQTSQTVNHTYTTFDTPVVIECVLSVASTIGGYACATLLKPSNVPTAITYVPKFLWAVYSSQTIALKNSVNQVPQFSARNSFFQRLYIDCPASTSLNYLTAGQWSGAYHVSRFTIPTLLSASGNANVSALTAYLGDYKAPITLNISAGNTIINGPGTPVMLITGSGANVLMDSSSYTRTCPYPLTSITIATNSVYGNWSYTFQNSPIEIIDFSACTYNALGPFLNNTGMSRLKTLLFPSYLDGNGVRQPRPLTGITSMGPVDISGAAIAHANLVETLRSLPVNATPVNCTITGSAGAADLTAEEIAIATSKNWVVIR